MRYSVSYAAGARAAEDLASALLGFSVHKAVDPTSTSGFLLIGERVAARLKTAVSGAEADAVREVVHSTKYDWAKLSSAAADQAVADIKKAIAEAYAKKVLPKVSNVLQVEGPSVMKGTKAAILAREKIQISGKLEQRDLTAEASIRKSQVGYIRNSTGDRVEKASIKARAIVATGVKQGVGTDQIALDLHVHFKESIPRPGAYWRTVADSFVGRARTTSQIFAYEDAGIETYEIVAVIDEVTTDQCRFMDGKVFTVQVARSLLDLLQSLDDPEDVKFANPWIRKGRDADGGMHLFVPHADGGRTSIAKIERSGVGTADDRGKFTGGKDSAELGKLGTPCPPFHGRCRTTLVAGAESADDAKAPVMVPGADLVEPTNAPAWMTADELNVVFENDAPGGMNGAKLLSVKDAEGVPRQGVWKPASTEARYLRKGIESGSYHQREAAMFELDSMIGGKGVVPPTVTRQHDGEWGSLQEFVPYTKKTHAVSWTDAADLAENRRVFLLDVIAANDDRHIENTLWTTAKRKLCPVAIDNGLTFPMNGPCRFLFSIPEQDFAKAMLTLDATSIEQLQALKLPDVAAMLLKHSEINEMQVLETLVRIKSLQTNPAQFLDMLELARLNPSLKDCESVVHEWLSRKPFQRIAKSELTRDELTELEDLCSRGDST